MEENEFAKLKDGNWVLHKGISKKIKKHVFKAGDAAFVIFKGESIAVSRNYITPIPLSDTLLLKNGFVFDSKYNFYSKNNEKICVSIAHDPNLLIGDGATTIEGNNNVHTLQNAYFTISQKELPITL